MDLQPTGTQKRAVTACSEYCRRKQKPYASLILRASSFFSPDTHYSRVWMKLRKRPKGLNTDMTSLPWLSPSRLAISRARGTSLYFNCNKWAIQQESSIKPANTAQTISFGILSPRDNWRSIGAPDPGTSQRYRELLSRLPPNAILADLVDVFFAQTFLYSQVLERFYFDKLHSDWLTSNAQLTTASLLRNIRFFSALISQVVAVALQFLPSQVAVRGELGIEDQEHCDKLSHTYKLGTWNSSVAWFGKRDQVSLSGSLMHSPTDASSHMAVILNRPRLIHLNDCSAKKPTDCEFPQDPSSCIPKASGIDGLPSSLAVQLFNYDIGCKVHAMFSSGTHTRHVSSYETVMNLDRDVREMLE
ncbi:uncharacterized protein NECHADRAFT_88820 [Fusarium vanettenii 77-13-4]|uniref:Transcription factor domain-containing protein n=1 Tax=Fusarium vanettenii (strain ATCC MYA-4622 / CBS 123669 / FGSC 9596 / NRRL 45880 / 77-13-4) TaxID=660122 RepID=C7ZQ15_FUSV7|nr:uncharacterized protein NECHADRAFT_88820 [Fusarium vanettenii 77-13-4]EEU33893.1 predicted protein [Fusarium vanettenii 77-13-4]